MIFKSIEKRSRIIELVWVLISLFCKTWKLLDFVYAIYVHPKLLYLKPQGFYKDRAFVLNMIKRINNNEYLFFYKTKLYRFLFLF